MERFTKEELEEVAHALRLNVSRICEKMQEYEKIGVNVTVIDAVFERGKMLGDLIRKVEDYINQEE